ncbi:hypothetical protein TREPR_3628 [Treponema primitia ZAS-2]|uniref:Uncharacterized protein n=1 Tax=Treponema primitia (strain ATCC BAA-887 / DSM 12427 / ZAS-2) TaxID=545694 RepID=F5YQZ9_TREPZ|nr:hypothetical protein TREPR_3628 [Treponema primitia ZAS-2]
MKILLYFYIYGKFLPRWSPLGLPLPVGRIPWGWQVISIDIAFYLV